MRKASSILVLLLSITMACFLVVKTYARPITSSERRFYAQNNIIFYVPGEEEKKDEEQPGSGDPSAPSGEGVDYLVDVAIKASWPTNGQCKSSSGSMIPWTGSRKDKECSSTINSFAETIRKNANANTLRDCAKFVASVVKYSKLDPSFPVDIVDEQMKYMNSSSKWTKVSTDNQEFPKTSLKPGDIIAYSLGRGNDGHIMLYIGSQTATTGSGKKVSVNIASASYNEWTPQLNKLNRMSTLKGTPYSVYRYTGN